MIKKQTRERPAGRAPAREPDQLRRCPEPARPPRGNPAPVQGRSAHATRCAPKLGADVVPEARAARGVGRPEGRRSSSGTARGTRSPSRSSSSCSTWRSASTCASRRGSSWLASTTRWWSSACSSSLQKEITLSTIAAVLTVVGYSMNDTVVVYDRIRENLGKHRGKSFAQVINLSVSRDAVADHPDVGRDDAERASPSSSGEPASSRISRSPWSSASSRVRTRASTWRRRSRSGSTSEWRRRRRSPGRSAPP